MSIIMPSTDNDKVSHAEPYSLSDRNADMASLVVLVTVLTADITECSVRKDIEGADAVVLHMTSLRYEERIVVKMILRHPPLEAVVIDVGRDEIQSRSGTVPDVYKMGQRAC